MSMLYSPFGRVDSGKRTGTSGATPPCPLLSISGRSLLDVTADQGIPSYVGNRVQMLCGPARIPIKGGARH